MTDKEYPRSSAGSVADGLLRERIAINLWHKFAPEHHMEWEEETHQAEYLLAADDVLFLTRNEPQTPCVREAVIEECARACEARIRGKDGLEGGNDWGHNAPYNAEDKACAAAIRALALSRPQEK